MEGSMNSVTMEATLTKTVQEALNLVGTIEATLGIKETVN